MSPENVTGYLCKRGSPTGRCLTSTPHPCSDVPSKKSRRPKAKANPPSLPRKEELFPSDVEDDSDKENHPPEDEPKAYPKYYLREEKGHYVAANQRGG